MSIVIPADVENVFKFWIDSDLHTKITNSPAKIDGRQGGKFTSWDNYISGKFIENEPLKKIIQSWRTTNFPEDAPDSILNLNFEKDKKGTKIILNHSKIPEGQANNYRKGWNDFYFDLMTNYYNELPGENTNK